MSRFVSSGAMTGGVLAVCLASAGAAAAGMEEIIVIGVTPTEGLGIDRAKVAARVQSASGAQIGAAQSADLTDYLNRALGSVSLNSAQGNPLQPDLQFRGFTASPLLGLPQGLAVYQDGARINEPFGDAVNWDLLPESAIEEISLIAGANPLYGLNSLGGALVVDMKNGFTFQGVEGEIAGGAWGRLSANVQAGVNEGPWGLYVNAEHLQEDGWRDLSPSEATTLYGALSWHGEATSVDLGVQFADTELNGNGPLPVGMLEMDRSAIFTAPDITGNKLHMVTLEGEHALADGLQISASGYFRHLETSSFNGDATELSECALGGGDALLEGLEEDDLEDLGLDEDDVCDGVTHADAEALETFLNGLAGGEEFEIRDLAGELSGTGDIEDDAINNISTREQHSYGGDLLFTSARDLFGRANHAVLGAGWHTGLTRFASQVELSGLDPLTRSTRGLGTGTFIDEFGSSVKTATRSWSIYFSDTLSLTETVAITVAGRYNDTAVAVRDRTGEHPELNGDHDFSRFNPAVGVTWQAAPQANVYGSWSQSSRAPTPIELSCNEGVFEVARRLALEAGEDPDDVDFECRLPNAFLADPPLEQVVTESFEAGVRGGGFLGSRYHVGFFHSTNTDDIIFQTTGRATGLFGNVDETRRLGVEAELRGQWGPLDWFLAYSWIDATFQSAFTALSPNHPQADADGRIAVSPGNRIPGIPAHQFKIGTDWRFVSGLTLGADLLVNSDQYLRGDESNTLDPIDGYAIVSLRARYAIGTHLELFARVDNLFDTDYENFGLIGEDPSEVLAQLTDTRPYFVGVGAPRAGWAGIRVKF
ncbi:MAG: TonB-dependent receptor [Gammaproteobacteria bacterium]